MNHAGAIFATSPSLVLNGFKRRVLSQRDIDGCSVSVAFRSKAQCAGNGYSLSKRCNADAGRHGDALRVSSSAPMDCVAPLGKGSGAIAGELRLAMNADMLTEPVTIILTEYYSWRLSARIPRRLVEAPG